MERLSRLGPKLRQNPSTSLQFRGLGFRVSRYHEGGKKKAGSIEEVWLFAAGPQADMAGAASCSALWADAPAEFGRLGGPDLSLNPKTLNRVGRQKEKRFWPSSARMASAPA